MISRPVFSAAVALLAIGCNSSKDGSSAATEPGNAPLQAPTTVAHAKCPVRIPSDSEIVEAKETSFTVKVKGGRPLFDPSILVVNSIVSIYDNEIEPDASNLKLTVDEKLADDGYALEGEFEKQGRKYYFVDRSIPCAPKAWLGCRIVTIEKKNADYASRVCKTLVAK